jgi:hypothetical protein
MCHAFDPCKDPRYQHARLGASGNALESSGCSDSGARSTFAWTEIPRVFLSASKNRSDKDSLTGRSTTSRSGLVILLHDICCYLTIEIDPRQTSSTDDVFSVSTKKERIQNAKELAIDDELFYAIHLPYLPSYRNIQITII